MPLLYLLITRNFQHKLLITNTKWNDLDHNYVAVYNTIFLSPLKIQDFKQLYHLLEKFNNYEKTTTSLSLTRSNS